MAKQVVVTGAGQGLGRAIVETLVERGWTVWATDIDPDGLRVSKAQHTASLDVTNPDAVANLFSAVHDAGGVDAVVNNAGIFPLRPWDEHDAELMHRVYDVNVIGPLRCTQAAANSMITRGAHGAIVNIVSLAFFKGHATGLAYAASKGALIGLTRSLAKALGPHHIRVNALAPGLMLTGGTQALIDAGAFPAHRLAGDDPDRTLPGSTEPSGVAAMVATLLSDDAGEMTGQVVVADGGTVFI
jgi:NAD(P)-dependent dehydrogenase (short-subunit alcohol dehydrogenase family)